MTQDLFGLVGTTIGGKYSIEEPVGEGGFSVVYRGIHRHLGQRVAVKVLKIPSHFDAAGRQVFIEQFCNEGRILSNLADHPSIVRVLDFGTTELAEQSLFYLVLEWLNGRDLETIFLERRAAFSERDAILLMTPAIEALALAHVQGIAHRDLKPANLYLADTKLGPRLKVLDFGIAKAIQEGEQTTRLTTHTASGFRAFSPPYGAPEQFRPKKHGATGAWTDVHALGLILVELVTGQPALVGEEEADFLIQSTSTERPTPRMRGAVVSDQFEAICRKALALEPRERYQNAQELLGAITSLGIDAAPTEPEFVVPARSGGTLVVPLQKWMATEVIAARTAAAPPKVIPVAPSFLAGGGASAVRATPVGGTPVGGTPVGGTPVGGTPPGVALAATAGAISALQPAASRRRPWYWGMAFTAVAAVVTTVVTLRLVPSLDPAISASQSQLATPPPSSSPAPASAAVAPLPSGSAADETLPPDLPETVTIPTGTFAMGSNGGDSDERPVHQVTVKSFLLDTTEVTLAKYERCYHAGPCSAPDTGASCNWGRPDRAQHPVNCVDAEQARAYCVWDKKRLPTEEELEYAAVGTDNRRYPWGDQAPTDDRLCWAKRDGTCPVGSRSAGASIFGVHDLAGNVSEWTSSRYCDSYSARRICTTGRVYRGSSFIELRPEVVRSAYRDEKDPKQRSPYLGFRCARSR